MEKQKWINKYIELLFPVEGSKTQIEEELHIEREEKAEQKVLIRKLRAALPYLTDLQRSTIQNYLF